MKENNRQQNNGKFEKNKDELTPLWKKETKAGKTYLSGKFSIKDLREKIIAMGKDVEWVNISVFVNGYKKEGSRQPDYAMMIYPMHGYQPADNNQQNNQQNNQNVNQGSEQRQNVNQNNENNKQRNNNDQYYDQNSSF